MSMEANNADPKRLAVDGGGHTDALGRTAFARRLSQLIHVEHWRRKVEKRNQQVSGLANEQQ